MMRRSRLYFGIMDMIDKAGSAYKPSEMTSKDILMTPFKTNQPHDPVANAERLRQITGPLKRKHNTNIHDYVSIDEAEKWMEVTHAAKLLGIEEKELTTLTAAKLEERWAYHYKQKTYAQQQELVIAAEVLLEYLDSHMYIKKSKQYYRDYVDNARSAIDQEEKMTRESWKHKLWLGSGVMIFGGCTMILIAAYLQGHLRSNQDLSKIGEAAGDYMGVLLTKSKNLEPPPDYGTRYHHTPTAVDVDEASGEIAKRLLDPTFARILTEKEEAERSEDALTVRLINEENERMARERQEAALLESTVVIHRKEDYNASGEYAPAKPAVTHAPSTSGSTAKLRAPTLGEYLDMAQHTFGGSKTQRFFSGSSERTKEAEAMNNRLRMLNPSSINEDILSEQGQQHDTAPLLAAALAVSEEVKSA